MHLLVSLNVWFPEWLVQTGSETMVCGFWSGCVPLPLPDFSVVRLKGSAPPPPPPPCEGELVVVCFLDVHPGSPAVHGEGAANAKAALNDMATTVRAANASMMMMRFISYLLPFLHPPSYASQALVGRM